MDRSGESLSRDEMGTLKFCLVGRWENPLDSYPSSMEMEAWAKKSFEVERESNGGLYEPRFNVYGVYKVR